jgi:hypothetical protein
MASNVGMVGERREPPQGKSLDEALGELLIARGHLDRAGFERAQRVHRSSDDRLHALLSKLGLVSEREIANGLAELLRLPLATEADYPDLLPFGDRVSAHFLREARVLPLADTDEGLVVAMADPLDSYTVGAMQLFAGKPVLVSVGVPADIEAALERLFGSAGGDEVQALGDITELGAEDDIQRLRDLASEAPVVRIVNRLIAKAAEALALPTMLAFVWLRTGRPGRLPTLDEARAYAMSPLEQQVATQVTATQIVGTPAQVTARMAELAGRTKASEIMLTTHASDHAARITSFELVNEAWRSRAG